MIPNIVFAAPAISLAYEQPESDIMRRKPRRVGIDRLVNRRLISFAYFQIGMIQALAAVFVAFVVLNDYGVAPSALPGSNRDGFWLAPQKSKQRWMYTEKVRFGKAAYTAAFFHKDNSAFKPFFASEQPGFIRQTEEEFKNVPSTSPQFDNMVKVIGRVTGRPACRPFSCKLPTPNDPACFTNADAGVVKYDDLTKETANPRIVDGLGTGQGCFELWSIEQQDGVLQRAQVAYLITIIMVQWSDVLICKTRYLSLFQHGMRNRVMIMGILLETFVGLALSYIPFLNSAFKTAKLKPIHLLPALPFVVYIVVYDEVRKYLIRQGDEGRKDKLSVFGRFIKSYTYY
jgi:magnesium-transporting ATPase (P-type)